MKTITFYSYKGGVGRSLALSKIAIRLSELGKKVCVLDFDLDAPGLRFKFVNYVLSKDITRGIVDHIYDFSKKGKILLRSIFLLITPCQYCYLTISKCFFVFAKRSLYYSKSFSLIFEILIKSLSRFLEKSTVSGAKRQAR